MKQEIILALGAGFIIGSASMLIAVQGGFIPGYRLGRVIAELFSEKDRAYYKISPEEAVEILKEIRARKEKP